jgi:hypothetical protein
VNFYNEDILCIFFTLYSLIRIRLVIGKDLLSEFDCLLTNGQGEPFHLSDHLCAGSLFLVIVDESNDIDDDFPWPLFEELIDEIQTRFEIIYIGADQKRRLEDLDLNYYFQMRMKMTGDEKGDDYHPC